MDQTATEGAVFNYALAGDTFHDDDFIHGDTLSYIASLTDGTALPSWLSFDASTQTFTGTASTDSVLTGTDGDDVLVDTDLGVSGAWNIQVVGTRYFRPLRLRQLHPDPPGRGRQRHP